MNAKMQGVMRAVRGTEPIKDILLFKTPIAGIKAKKSLKKNVHIDLPDSSPLKGLYESVFRSSENFRNNETALNALKSEMGQVNSKVKRINSDHFLAGEYAARTPASKKELGALRQEVEKLEKTIKGYESARRDGFNTLKGQHAELNKIRDNSLARSLGIYAVPLSIPVMISDAVTAHKELKKEGTKMNYNEMISKVAGEIVEVQLEKMASTSEPVSNAGAYMVEGLISKIAAVEKFQEAQAIRDAAVEGIQELGFTL